MGRNPKPLTILIHPDYDGEGWVSELRQKGHTVCVIQSIVEADLVLAPQAARFLPGMEKYLETFVKGARTLRYGGRREIK